MDSSLLLMKLTTLVLSAVLTERIAGSAGIFVDKRCEEKQYRSLENTSIIKRRCFKLVN